MKRKQPEEGEKDINRQSPVDTERKDAKVAIPKKKTTFRTTIGVQRV